MDTNNNVGLVTGESLEDWLASYQNLKLGIKKLWIPANKLLRVHQDYVTTPEYEELQLAMREYQVESENDMFTYGLKERLEKAIENFNLMLKGHTALLP